MKHLSALFLTDIAVFVLLAACGGSSVQRAASKVTGIEDNAKKIASRTGTATEKKYEATYTLKATNGKVDCPSAGNDAQKLEGGVIEIHCLQSTSPGQLACDINGTTLNGFVDSTGEFGLSTDQMGGSLDGVDLSGAITFQGNFSAAGDTATGTLEGGARGTQNGKEAACAAKFDITLTRKDISKTENAASSAASVALTYDNSSSSGSRKFHDVRVRTTGGVTQIGAKGMEGERVLLAFDSNGSLSGSARILDRSGKPIQTGELADCNYTATQYKTRKGFAFECAGIQGTANVPTN